MRIAMFYHSLVSDWNHGNAHFLRGVVRDLRSRGHEVTVYEPADSWSRRNLVAEHGEGALDEFCAAYPGMSSVIYEAAGVDFGAALDGVDLAVVHEWNDPALVAALGAARRARPGMRLLFHDTHHRAVSEPGEMERYDLSGFDGALVFGGVLRELYLERGWAREAWTWHEAADTEVFRPRAGDAAADDLVWIGNWGGDERAAELHEFLLGPVRTLGLRATVYGVRYPAEARRALRGAGIHYGGWLANPRVPEVFASARVTVHVPRRPYVRTLPGIPTIRVFEALACGIPLVCSPWEDREGLFTPGRNYLTAENGAAMCELLRFLLDNPEQAAAQAERGLMTIRRRHTCAHRVDELLGVCRSLGLDAGSAAAAPAGMNGTGRAATNGAGTTAGRGAGRGGTHHARPHAAAAGDPQP